MLSQKKSRNKYVVSYNVIDANDQSRFCMREVHAYTEKQAWAFICKINKPDKIRNFTVLSVVESKPLKNKKIEQISLF